MSAVSIVFLNKTVDTQSVKSANVHVQTVEVHCALIVPLTAITAVTPSVIRAESIVIVVTATPVAVKSAV